MTSASPGPYFVRVFSHSAFGPHVQEIPIKNWSNVVSTNPHGQIDKWSGGSTDAQTMIEDLVALEADFFPSTYTFDNWAIYSQPTPADPAHPVTGEAFSGLVGTSAASGWSKAVEGIFTWRATDFSLVKLVMLDMESGNDFDRVPTLATTPLTLLDAEFTNPDKGWSSRQGAKPQTFIGVTKDLNDKLRKAYRMV